jgi:hypothetical protein
LHILCSEEHGIALKDHLPLVKAQQHQVHHSPSLGRGQERGLIVIATRANHRTNRPAQTLDKVKATVGFVEITNRFDERIGKVLSCVIHTLILKRV